MKHIVIGTAGHVDHGKTLLIQSLTGINTDRLKEEQKRGITIDLGFAFFTLPGGERVGIIDVPGHEKFVKNMLAGAGGIDLALLVVAADDGVMPQTREHLGILSLLGIEEGLIVLTKIDLVEEGWVELVSEDIRGAVQGSFLQNAPILPVSAYTGAGMEALRAELIKLAEKTASKDVQKPFRIPIDRVFSAEGHGTVITGTLIEGQLHLQDEVEIYPAGLRTRVRNLQVHTSDVQTAYAGQRVAVNLAGVKKEDVQRGQVLSAPQAMENSMMLDVKLQCLPEAARVLRNGSRLHFYHGTRDILAKLVLLGIDELHPGQEAFAQLRFTEEVAAKKGDRFVVRFYSPIETVGGGTILDPVPRKHRRNDTAVQESLKVREQGSAADNLQQAIEDASAKFTPLKEIQKQLVLDDETFRRELEGLLAQQRVRMVSAKVVIGVRFQQQLLKKLQILLDAYHQENPLKAGMRRDELRGKLLFGLEISLADKVLALFEEDGQIVSRGACIALATFTVSYSEEEAKMAAHIERLFLDGAFAPPSLDEVLAHYPKNKTGAKRVFDSLLDSGVLTLAASQIFFHSEHMQKAQAQTKAFIEQNGSITLAQFRDLVGTSRKFALAILEYFDNRRFTRMQNEARVLV